MDRLFYEVPTIDRKNDAIDYIKEHYKYNSPINGVGGLDRYLEDYEGWLKKLDNDLTCPVTDRKVPGATFFLVRELDNKIIGMINIRFKLNKMLEESGIGHIGYGIRPTERRKGYNKVNLYLGLLELHKVGVKTALLGAHKDNPASWKTMLALGANLLRESEFDGKEEYVYTIDVDDSISKYKDVYEPMIKK